ncbi:MAG: prepilin peptidase [Planctomycetes bacterium]|nr:prepilin peptidase [Planctomycetota bacterium]
MRLFTPEYWPIHVICVGMIAAAVIDWWKFKVPNKLTFPLIVSGWVLGLANNFGLGAGVDGIGGGIGSALAGTCVGMGLLLPVYAIGGMGAGDVKMTMGFGSWIGAFFGMPDGLWIIFWAFCAGTIVGGVIALVMIVLRGNYMQNASHVREIVGDMFQSTGVGEIADKANRRRPRWHRLPYGVPLCIGFLGYLFYLHGF